MIVPLVEESKWERLLVPLPVWTPSLPTENSRVVIVSPHPDDETLGAGGLIASLTESNIEVVLVAVTDGENAYPNSPGLGLLRELEQQRAATKLGIQSDIVRLRLPDSGVTAHETKLTQCLTELIDERTLVVAPWTGDFHPDHEACGRASLAAASDKGSSIAFYFFWTWHRGTPALLSALPLRAFPLQPKWLAAKQAALKEHHSQLLREDGEPILPERLLLPASRPYEVFLLP